VLEVSAWIVRLALLALLGAAAYLYFRPGELPIAVTETLNGFPFLRAFLPEPGTPYFGICAAALIVIPLLPVLAMLDVTRKLAGWRLRRLHVLVAERTVVEQPAAPDLRPAPVSYRVNRRTAADTLAEAGSRKPLRGPSRPK
jgi:hypothetical protein